MAILFKAVAPKHRTVTCTVEQWNSHVLDKGGMLGREETVRKAIEHPEVVIYRDVDYVDREVYYTLVPRYLRVVVEFENEEFGNVIRAFPTANSKKGETVMV
jgi:hypothetical protein